MLHRYLAKLAILKASYEIYLERRCKIAPDVWIEHTGAFLSTELLRGYQEMLVADAVAIQQFRAIGTMVLRVPPECIDIASRREIESMLADARKVTAEYYRRFDRDPKLTDFMRKAAASIATDLHQLKTTGA